jgi:hypothetical protein
MTCRAVYGDCGVARASLRVCCEHGLSTVSRRSSALGEHAWGVFGEVAEGLVVGVDDAGKKPDELVGDEVGVASGNDGRGMTSASRR